MITPPTIRTDRLLVRSIAPGDAPELTAVINDQRIASTTLNIPHPYALKDAEDWIALQPHQLREGTGVNFVIVLDGRIIGGIGLAMNRRHDSAELGYWIAPAHWGNGYASEAARAVICYAFEDLGLNRVYADHFARNPASGRVMLKIGMKPEGVRRQHLRKGDVYEDAVCYGILRRDWERW